MTLAVGRLMSGTGGHHIKTGLLQLSVGRPSPVDTAATLESAERRCMAHLRHSTLQTHTPHLHELHWLLVHSTIKYKLCLMMKNVYSGHCASYPVPIRYDVVCRYTITSTSSALCRSVELCEAANSDKIRRTGFHMYSVMHLCS